MFLSNYLIIEIFKLQISTYIFITNVFPALKQQATLQTSKNQIENKDEKKAEEEILELVCCAYKITFIKN